MEQDSQTLALVTGGAHPMGIGYAAAKALLGLGFEVIVTGLSEAEIAGTPLLPGLSARVMDVTDDASVAGVMASLPRLHALVTCAGAANLSEFELEGFERTVQVNLVGTMRSCMQAHPLLSRQGGAIVTIGSMYSIFGSTMAPGYAASKGGVAALSRSFAASWGKDGIRVNCVAPGWIRTNMSRMMWENETYAAPVVARTPMGRWGDPQELGDVIGFLCAPQSRFVTGTLIPVDGGYSISG